MQKNQTELLEDNVLEKVTGGNRIPHDAISGGSVVGTAPTIELLMQLSNELQLQIGRNGTDAEGLRISEKMRGQIRGLLVASTNAQDGIALINQLENEENLSPEITEILEKYKNQLMSLAE